MTRRGGNAKKPDMNTSATSANTSESLASASAAAPDPNATPPELTGPLANTPGPPAEPETIKLKHLSRLLHVPARWRILRELAKGEALPVNELARRVNCRAATVSKHMALLKVAGVVKVGYGRCYKLSSGVSVEPGGRRLDLGHCILKLDTKW